MLIKYKEEFINFMIRSSWQVTALYLELKSVFYCKNYPSLLSIWNRIKKKMDFVFDLITSTNWEESIIFRHLVVPAKFNHKFVIAYAQFG